MAGGIPKALPPLAPLNLGNESYLDDNFIEGAVELPPVVKPGTPDANEMAAAAPAKPKPNQSLLVSPELPAPAASSNLVTQNSDGAVEWK